MTRAESGFTLIEVLVAFAIAAMSLTLLLRIQTNSAGTVVVAEEYLIATELAQSLLDELSVTEASLDFARAGRFADKYVWTVRADRYVNQATDRPERGAASAGPDTDADLPFALREIAVSITWPSRDRSEHIELRTIRPFTSREPGSEAPSLNLGARVASVRDSSDDARTR
jgi:general secretion pathway protein I